MNKRRRYLAKRRRSQVRRLRGYLDRRAYALQCIRDVQALIRRTPWLKLDAQYRAGILQARPGVDWWAETAEPKE